MLVVYTDSVCVCGERERLLVSLLLDNFISLVIAVALSDWLVIPASSSAMTGAQRFDGQVGSFF